MRSVGLARFFARESGRAAAERFMTVPKTLFSLSCKRCGEHVAIESANRTRRMCLACVDIEFKNNAERRRARLCK